MNAELFTPTASRLRPRLLLLARQYDASAAEEAFEKVSQTDENCYGINSMNELTDKVSLRNLIIGDSQEHYITIGQDYDYYVNVNLLDASDTTKTHRFAYALEWREVQAPTEKGSIEVRYIITYAKILSDEDLLRNDKILLLFNGLKQQYESGRDKRFVASSIYLFCKQTRESGFFKVKGTQEELGQLKDEVATLYNKETDPACDRYLKLALDELDKIQ